MQIHQNDNVRVDLNTGFKYAIAEILAGENVIKYGHPIGHAIQDIHIGELVHTHNLRTNLSGTLEYSYIPKTDNTKYKICTDTFMGYLRPNGDIGIRNEIWIIPTVGCVNKIADQLAKRTGAHAFPHPFGCSQMGDDQQITQYILKGLVNHPNAAGVLVIGLGCENNNIPVFQKILGEYDPARVKFLNSQDEEDEIAAGLEIIRKLQDYAAQFKREPYPVSRLKIGLKCGGSDGLSGITANPLLGRFCDRLTDFGGSCVLTEVPEMFGAEHLLMERCANLEVFNKAVTLINDFKDYYAKNNQVIYENPSPGNKAGGITTLEEKSLGCVQKGGSATVTDILAYGDTIKTPGLSLLNGPGNDIVAVTNLAAAGAHIILFTTGRGTPLGAPVPTVKVATNSKLAQTKKNWIDFDASVILDGQNPDKDFWSYILAVASGEETKNEIYDYREISIFKSGVTL